MSPPGFTTTMASGAASSSPRYRPSIWARCFSAILPPPRELDAVTDLLRQRFCRGASTVGDQPFREALGNDVLHLLAYQFIAAVAELLFRLNIQQDDLAARLHHHHRIRSRFQQSAVLLARFLALAQIAAEQRAIFFFAVAEHLLG